MEVILQEKIHSLGKLGDLVKVKPGYGRNYLIPFGKAVLATPKNRAAFEARRAELEQLFAEALRVAQERADVLAKITLTIPCKAGEEGKLYGSVGIHDIALAATTAGTKLAKSEIRLPTGPIRMLGEYEVSIHLHSDVNATIKVIVVPE